MEWKVLSILIIVYQLDVLIRPGITKSASLMDKKENSVASVAFCNPDQSYFCINLTHYRPCISVELLNGINTVKEFWCGSNRCCQIGAATPCAYNCQRHSYSFENPNIPWKLSPLWKKKKRRKMVSLASGEVDRMNKIISVKNFIIRQKDVDEWMEHEKAKTRESVWKPSYRTSCPLGNYGMSYTNLLGKSTTYLDTKLTTITTRITTPATTATPITERKTSDQVTTTTTKLTTKRMTKRTRKPAIRGPRSTRKTKKPGTKISMTCSATTLYRKISIPGTCRNYRVCMRVTKTKKRTYAWKIQNCPKNQYFSAIWQFCQKRELVPCEINQSKAKG